MAVTSLIDFAGQSQKRDRVNSNVRQQPMASARNNPLAVPAFVAGVARYVGERAVGRSSSRRCYASVGGDLLYGSAIKNYVAGEAYALSLIGVVEAAIPEINDVGVLSQMRQDMKAIDTSEGAGVLQRSFGWLINMADERIAALKEAAPKKGVVKVREYVDREVGELRDEMRGEIGRVEAREEVLSRSVGEAERRLEEKFGRGRDALIVRVALIVGALATAGTLAGVFVAGRMLG